jgi:hypothetical protein
MAAVATMTTIKMKATGAAAAAWWQRIGGGGGSAAAVAAAARPSAAQPPPLPTQAGEDAAAVHPTPITTTALFGSGFLDNLVRRPQAVNLPPVLHHRVIGLDPPLVEPLNIPYKFAPQDAWFSSPA